VDDYFARCRLVAFDHRAAGIVNRQESEYQTIATKEMTLAGDEVAGFPLAKAEAGRPLLAVPSTRQLATPIAPEGITDVSNGFTLLGHIRSDKTPVAEEAR